MHIHILPWEWSKDEFIISLTGHHDASAAELKAAQAKADIGAVAAHLAYCLHAVLSCRSSADEEPGPIMCIKNAKGAIAEIDTGCTP